MPKTLKLSRAEQARINGAKSQGPTTPEGKAISSSNAIKHGFAAMINVVLTVEEESDFLLHLAGDRSSFIPTNYMEQTLVDQLASISWRQARLVGLESALIAAQISLQDAEVCAANPECANDNYFHLVQAWQALASPPRPRPDSQDTTLPPQGYDINSMELLRRYQTSLDRQFRNTLLNLRLYRKDLNPTAASAQPNEPNCPSEIVQPTTSPSKATHLRPPVAAPESTPTGPVRIDAPINAALRTTEQNDIFEIPAFPTTLGGAARVFINHPKKVS